MGETTMNRPQGTRGCAYLRVSDGSKQDLDSQRQSIKNWLQQQGLSVQVWYTDSGSRDLAYRRPDFQRMLRAIEAGRWDWVLVDHRDRFGTADHLEFGKFACALREAGCQLWSVSQGDLLRADLAGQVLAVVDSEASHREQQAKSQRSIRGKINGAAKGQWQGGYPGLGFDLACIGRNGEEKWRVFYEGHHKRVRLWPDGRPSERFDGRGNFPGRDPGDTIRLVPSCDKKRIENARLIFRWFATEATSLRALCTRLNSLGISSVIGKGFYPARLGQMLRNPAYVGAVAWNKRGHGRFYEFCNGEYQVVPREKGRAKGGRERQESDHIRSESEGLIDRDVWDLVQAKLRGIHKTGKAPRNPDLWLAGLLYCGQCGRRMSGWARKNNPLCYTCANYKQFGEHNEHGCQLHCVRAEVIEKLLDRYLAESGQKLSTILSVQREDQLLDVLASETDDKMREYLKTLHRVWQEVRRAGAVPPDGQPWCHSNLCDAYRAVSPKQQAEQVHEKREELDGMLRQFARLTNPVAIERMERLIDELGQEIEALEARPLDEVLQSQRDTVLGLEQRLREARTVLAGDQNRQKAQAVGRVLARIVCRFTHQKDKSQVRSILTEVVFEPLFGEALTMPTGMDGRVRDKASL